MSEEVKIQTNPPDLLKPGKQFLLREGQTVINGEIVLQDGAEFIFEDTASLLVTDC